MSNETGKRRGRPAVAVDGASVTLRVDASKLDLADRIAAALDGMMAGMRHTRGDVLRAALARGLGAMSDDLGDKVERAER